MSIARVQSKTANSASGTSLAVTLDSTPVAGDILIASVGVIGTGAVEFTQTGVVWTIAPKIGASNCFGMLAIGRVKGSPSATLTITTPSGQSAVAIAEYSGTNIQADVAASATGTSTSAASGDATTTVANELWVGSIVSRSSVTFSSPTNSFSIVGQDKSSVGNANDRSVALLERIVTATGTANAGATLSGSNVWTAQVFAMYEVSSGGGPLIGPGRLVRA